MEYLGAAAVSEGRVSGVLTADETQLALRVLDEARRRVARDGEHLQLQMIIKEESDLANETARIHALMQKLQALDSDALLFGGICAMGFRTNAEWDAYGFRTRYHLADTVVQIE